MVLTFRKSAMSAVLFFFSLSLPDSFGPNLCRLHLKTFFDIYEKLKTICLVHVINYQYLNKKGKFDTPPSPEKKEKKNHLKKIPNCKFFAAKFQCCIFKLEQYDCCLIVDIFCIFRARDNYSGYPQDSMGNIQVSQGGGDPGPSTSQVNPTSTGPQTPKRARLGLERPELQPLQIDIKKVE